MKKIILFVLFASFSLLSFAESGFLDDYSKLQVVDGVDRSYINPVFLQSGSRYESVMIDLPEIFISADSKYKGMKPHDMAALAESFREAIISTIGDSYNVVETPGDGVLFISWALTEVHLKKAKRGFFTYTPIGAVVHATKTALEKDFENKISLIALTVELEVTDSQSGEIMGQMVEPRGDKEEPTSWDEVNELMLSYGTRLKCRLDNTRRDEQMACRQ